MSTTVKNNPNKSTDGKGQKLTAVRVLDIILDGTSETAKKFGGYDSVGTIFYTILENDTPNEEISTANIARPIFSNTKYYPLKNEIVLILSSKDKSIYNNKDSSTSYYFPPLNIWNHPHHNALPSLKGLKESDIKQDYLYTENGIVRQVTDEGTNINLGNYFSELLKIKPLLPYEGDYILEGRFGNSIRLGSTNIGENIPDEANNTWSTIGNIGDPITIIRNGQSDKLDSKGWVPTIEDLNDDATSIYLTSNQQLSDFRVASTNFQSYQAKLELPKDLDTALTDPELNIVVQPDPIPVQEPVPVSDPPVLQSPSNPEEEEVKTPFDQFMEDNQNDDISVSEIEDRTEIQQITPGSSLSLGTSYQETPTTGPVNIQEKIGSYFNLSQLIYSKTAVEKKINNLPGVDPRYSRDTIINNLKNLMENVGDKIYEKYPTMVISSAYRSLSVNKAIGGSDTSQHRKGMAIDIQIPNVNTSEVFNWVITNIPLWDQVIWEFPERGFPPEGSWVHISYGDKQRKQKKIATSNATLKQVYNVEKTYAFINNADQSKVPS